MCKALKVTPSLYIDVNDDGIVKHAGFGSSGATLGAVCSAINELYDCPIGDLDMVKYIVGNYGEEIKNDAGGGYLKVVPATGGSLATGFKRGGVMVVTGEGVRIGQTTYNGKAIVGVPRDFKPQTADVMMDLEEVVFKNSVAMMQEIKDRDLLYTIVHKALPELMSGRVTTLGDLVFNFRFDGPGIVDCRFIYSRVVDIGKALRPLYEKKHCDMLALSSIGPAFFALVNNEKDEKLCIAEFEKQKLATESIPICNSRYTVEKVQYRPLIDGLK